MELMKTQCWVIRRKGTNEFLCDLDFFNEPEQAIRFRTREDAERTVQNRGGNVRLEILPIEITIVTTGPIEGFDVPKPLSRKVD